MNYGRRSFIAFGGGLAALATVPLAGCGGGGSADNFPPVASGGSGPQAMAQDGRKFQVDGNTHTLAITSGGSTKRVGALGRGAGQLNYPAGVAVLNGNAYVVEKGNHRVQMFDGTGKSLGTFGEGTLLYPGGIAAGSSEIYVADSRNARVAVYTPGGALSRVIGEGVLSAPRGMAVSADGLIVADPGLRKVLKFGNDGSVTQLGAGWVLPWDAATDGSNVYVADVSRSSLGVVTPEGANVGSIALAKAASNVSFSSGTLIVA